MPDVSLSIADQLLYTSAIEMVSLFFASSDLTFNEETVHSYLLLLVKIAIVCCNVLHMCLHCSASWEL